MDWRELWRSVFPRRMIESDVREEVSFHIEGRIRELVEMGWDEEAARSHVLERFGDPESVEAACRRYGVQRTRRKERKAMMEAWIRDARHASKGMMRNPAFTAAVVVTLALGIGATTAVFSVLEGFLLRPLPFPDPDRLVVVWENDRATGTTRESASPSDYYDFVDRARGFDGFAVYALNSAVLTRPEADPLRLSSAQVTANLPGILGIHMQLGRGFTPEEDAPGGPQAVILTDAIWKSAFQADPRILGRTVTIDDLPHVVAGVLPPGTRYPSGDTDIWVPIQLSRATATRPNHWVNVVARMAPGTDLAGAQAEMSRVMVDLEVEYPQDNTNRGAFVEALGEVGRGDLRATLWVLFGAVLSVLAIACVNVANLLLARGASRSRELAVRVALGAGGREIRRAFLVEGILVTGVASLLGLALAILGTRGLTALAPARLLHLGAPEMNASVLAFTTGTAASIALGFAFLPSLRSRKRDLQAELREGRTGEGGTPRIPLRRALVSGQLSLAVVLLVGATLLMTTLRNLQAVDPGFDAEDILRVDYTLPPSRYPRDFARWPNWVEVNQFNRSLVERARAIPGVRSAAVVTNHPLDRGFTNSFQIEGQEYDPGQGEITTRMVTPGYFGTVGLRLVDGRLPLSSEGTDDASVIVLNRKAVERYFPEGGAVGSRISFWGQSHEVVGVVENERMHGLSEEVPPALYVNLLQTPPVATKITLLVRTEVPPLQMADAVRRTIWSLDPDLAVFDVSTMEATLADASARERFASVVLMVFAGVALFLSILGVHGVLAYLVAQRTHEVGVRMALGATRANVVRAVVAQGAWMALMGIVAGVLAALAASGLLRSLLFGVSPTAPWAYAAVAAGLGAVALAATLVPAWRAASVSPATSLRGD